PVLSPGALRARVGRALEPDDGPGTGARCGLGAPRARRGDLPRRSKDRAEAARVARGEAGEQVSERGRIAAAPVHSSVVRHSTNSTAASIRAEPSHNPGLNR